MPTQSLGHGSRRFRGVMRLAPQAPSAADHLRISSWNKLLY